ncbi:MAG: 30S ribosomal protein S6 [Elusimicrobiota bacterium]|jgi:small subunit ribosomal protein S6|nr:30S ribosomal protein S6 [Elusimicrobiota bacterium]
MNCYEFIYALDPETSVDVIEEFNNKIQTYIIEKSGTIESFDTWGLKKFAYPVSKKLEGNFFLLKFNLAAENILQINEMSRIDEKVLRYNIMKIEKDFSLRKKKFKKVNLNHELEEVKNNKDNEKDKDNISQNQDEIIEKY